MLKNLKALRETASVSQKQLAEAIGISQQSINKYENHNIEPDIDTLIRIADFFDTSVDYEELKRDYFTHAYGEIADDVIEYLTAVSKAFDINYMMVRASTSSTQEPHFYKPEHVPSLQSVRQLTAKIAPVLEAHKNMPYRAQTVAVRLLQKHLEYCDALSDIWALKAQGKDLDAVAAYNAFLESFGKYEAEIQTYFDQYMFHASISRLIVKPSTFYTAE